MTQQRPGNTANLKAAAGRRHQAAVTRAEAGLQKLTHSGQQITFRGVAKAAGVSLEFLYNHPQLRSRIEHLRACADWVAVWVNPRGGPLSTSERPWAVTLRDSARYRPWPFHCGSSPSTSLAAPLEDAAMTAREELGWRPRPAETTIVETAESLRDLGLLEER
jgi:hypothetical protein